MPTDSPVQHVAPDLLRVAAAEPTWGRALRLLALAVTQENVVAFRERAGALDIDVSHLRWRRRWSGISTEELQAVVDGSSSYADVLEQLGVQPGGRSYTQLEQFAMQRGVSLPEKRHQRIRRERQGLVGRVSDEDVRRAFTEAQSMADLLRRVGLVPKGGNYEVMRNRLQGLGLDPKQLRGQSWSRGRSMGGRPLSDLLKRGQPYSGPPLARRLIEAGLVKRECTMCGLREWLGLPIPLELDHINGEHDDNRLENLRLLCPNCHATTPTYRGRNVRQRRETMLAVARVAKSGKPRGT